MNNRFLIIRKDRKCDYCEAIFCKGTRMNFFESRMPAFDKIDNQIGIEFIKSYMCESCYTELVSPNPNSFEAQGNPPY